jgi:hypothetical protein
MIEKFQSLEVRGRKSSKPWKFFAVLFPMLGSLAMAQGPGSISQGGFFQAWWGVTQVRFTPLDLNNLAAWFDMSDATTISVQAGTNLVNQIDDKSGNAKHVTGSGTSRPAYIASSNAVFFAGDDFLTKSDAAMFRQVSSWSLYAVINYTALSGSNPEAISVRAGDFIGTASRALILNINPNLYGLGGRRNNSDGFTSTSGGSNTLNDVKIHGGVADYDATDIFQYVDGTLISSNTSWLTAGTTPNDGGLLALGRGNGGEFYLYEAIFVAGTNVMTTLERQKLEGYLAHRWNIQSKLPVNHPYKNAPP